MPMPHPDHTYAGNCSGTSHEGGEPVDEGTQTCTIVPENTQASISVDEFVSNLLHFKHIESLSSTYRYALVHTTLNLENSIKNLD